MDKWFYCGKGEVGEARDGRFGIWGLGLGAWARVRVWGRRGLGVFDMRKNGIRYKRERTKIEVGESINDANL